MVRLLIVLGCTVLALCSSILSSLAHPWIVPAWASFKEQTTEAAADMPPITASQIEATLRELLNNEHRLISSQIDREFLIDPRYTASQACDGGFAFGTGTIVHPGIAPTITSGKITINNCHFISGSLTVEHSYRNATNSELRASGSVYASRNNQARISCKIEIQKSSNNSRSAASISSQITCAPVNHSGDSVSH